MSARRSEWFASNVKPAMPGVYQRKFAHGILYSYWTGIYWTAGSYRPESTHPCRPRTKFPGKQWRGLAVKP